LPKERSLFMKTVMLGGSMVRGGRFISKCLENVGQVARSNTTNIPEVAKRRCGLMPKGEGFFE
jgi:hypothetical protein